MKKSRVVLSAIAAGAIVALTAPAAQAGGAAGAATLTAFFECEPVNGPKVGEVVSTWNFDDTLRLDGVKVGKPVMRCRQVNVKDAAGVFLAPPLSDEITCYAFNTPSPHARSEVVAIQDAFRTETVRVFHPQILCGPSIPTIIP